MAYDSPKQIRTRQQRQNEAARRTRQSQKIEVMSDERWSAVCNYHIAYLRDRQEAGLADSAGRHARTLVTMAVQRRATELMRDFGMLSVWKAMDVARHQLLNVEVA